jgi:predicted negative regulator of RcsB-dependent stress response
LGCAQLGARRPAEAVAALERTVALNEEHAYGGALLRLAEAQQAERSYDAALATLERHDRAYGPTPESAYRRGLAQQALGRREAAQASFDEVARSAADAARYQRGEARGWVARAFLARRFG